MENRTIYAYQAINGDVDRVETGHPRQEEQPPTLLLAICQYSSACLAAIQICSGTLCVRKCDASNRTLYEYYRLSSANRIEMPNIWQYNNNNNNNGTSKWNVYVYEKVPRADRRRGVLTRVCLCEEKLPSSREIEKGEKSSSLPPKWWSSHAIYYLYTLAFVLCGIIISHHHFIRPHICVNVFLRQRGGEVEGEGGYRRWHYTFLCLLFLALRHHSNRIEATHDRGKEPDLLSIMLRMG